MKSYLSYTVAALALAWAGTAQAQAFKAEGAVIDTRNGSSLGVVTERGELAALFKAQKAMTFGILRSAGISLEQLSPEVRARIERFQTTNVEAFRAFSQGLDLKDQGKFAEAREFFRRAAELDPNFALASEQQVSMPDVNLSSNVQLRTVVAAAAGAAVERGKVAYAVDLNRALAAVQAGQTVVLLPPEPTRTAADNDYSSNPPGAGAQFSANRSVGLIYNFSNTTGDNIGLPVSAEWSPSEVRLAGSVLETVGSDRRGFVAARGNAQAANGGSQQLADGSVAYWGSWLSSAPGGSAEVRGSGGVPLRAPTLGQVDWMVADAPRVMPSSGSVSFTPAGGLMRNVSGQIQVDFLNRNVQLQNLGFQIAGLSFSGLNGSASYAANSAAGAFQGNYSTGACTGCPAFSAQSSLFGGTFAGAQANGLIFTTTMVTGSGTAAGVHLFTRP
jgi:hypothetical protein